MRMEDTHTEQVFRSPSKHNESQNNNMNSQEHRREIEMRAGDINVLPAERQNVQRTESSDGGDEQGMEINNDISERVDTRHSYERERTRIPNGHHQELAREGVRGRPTYVHSYRTKTKSWLGWSSRVAATSNIEIVLRVGLFIYIFFYLGDLCFFY